MVTLEGDLTISNINSIKTEIQKQLSLDSSLKITVSEVSEMDITFLQLLLRLESAGSRVSIDVTPESKKKICEFLQAYGYHKELNLLNTEN